MTAYEIVVIGGGPAAITVAKMLGKKNIAIIRPEPASMIYCAMPYVIEKLIEKKTTLKSDALVTDGGAVLIRDTVEAIDFPSKILRLASGESLGYKKLIIATGAVPFIPPIPGHQLNGVTGFKTEADLTAIDKSIDTGLTRAAVVGAGAIGVELSIALNLRGVEVHLVDMANSVLPNLLDQEMSTPLRTELEEMGIHLHLPAKAAEVIDSGSGTVEALTLDSGEVISLRSAGESTAPGLVVFAAGTHPEISLVKDSPVETGRDGVVVNDRMETNVPDVYAVGDCTQFTSGITGKVVPGKLATNAIPMAKILGFNLLGQDRHYQGFFNGAATKIGKYYIGGTGLTESGAGTQGFDVVTGYSTVTTKFPIIPGAKTKKIKLVAEKGTRRVLGAQIVSEEPVVGRIDLITFAIQKQATVEDLAALSYAAQPHQSFYPAANVVVLASEEILKQEREQDE